MAGDANYGDVVLLLHCDGTNGSTTFTDSSPTPKTVTAVGNAQISTAQYLYGGASMLLDGTGDLFTVPSNSEFAFGTADFTIDIAFRIATLSTAFLIDMRPNPSTNGGYATVYIETGTLKYYVNSGVRITGGTVVINTWYRLRVSRVSGITRMFLEGAQIGSSYTDATNYVTAPINFGAASTGASPFNGNFDEIRITKYGRSSADFTPDAAAFPDYAGQVSGIVRDSANALCQRTVRAYNRSTGALVGNTTSNATTGAYTLNCSAAGEVTVLFLDDAAGTVENDLVLRTTPG